MHTAYVSLTPPQLRELRDAKAQALLAFSKSLQLPAPLAGKFCDLVALLVPGGGLLCLLLSALLQQAAVRTILGLLERFGLLRLDRA